MEATRMEALCEAETLSESQIQRSWRIRIVKDMEKQEQPGPDGAREELDAFSRQSNALNEIDEAIRSDEPAGEKIKKSVKEHIEACDEIKDELEAHKARPSLGEDVC
jgi:hypothetical protein